MQTSYRRILLIAALLLPLLAATVLTPVPTQAATTSALDFHNQMRKLWEDHITWTRLTIVGVFTDDPETPTTIQRLLQNQVDIGNAIKPYYGDVAGDQLTALLHDHISGAADLLKAAKAGDQAAIKAASDKWYANGDQIATFLSSANPQHWPLDTLKAMMKMHLDTTLAEALANLKKDYSADVAAYDAVHLHILNMADALSSGIIAQFPDRFGGATGVEAGTVLFPQTGFRLGGTFLSYWRANGGLPIFGYPINVEQSVDGRVVQWTERARLEQHPENRAPYNVLLGQLGTEALERRGIDWRSLPTVDSAPRGCRYFAETRHALCGDFLRYWSSHGLEFDRRRGKSFAESLALFGYPLSEPQMEQGADGNTYLIQWFERARFELHPNNPRPFQVLLGRLGAEALGR